MPISWWRMYRGKVWHVGWSDDHAACGSERPADAETAGERAPVNARVCGDCVASALHMYGLAQSAQMADPRTKTTTLTMSDPVTPAAELEITTAADLDALPLFASQPTVAQVKAEAWDEGHRYTWRRAMSDCTCSAWSSIECDMARASSCRWLTTRTDLTSWRRGDE